MNNLVVGDADALIALALEKDPHHQIALAINNKLIRQRTILTFPVTVFPEAITSLKRAFNQPKKAHLINRQLQQGQFQVEYINQEIVDNATKIFDQAISKRNTFFDAIVAATAKIMGADSIFSFDNWYPKLGFKLAGK